VAALQATQPSGPLVCGSPSLRRLSDGRLHRGPFSRRRGVEVKALRAVTAFGWTLSDLIRIELYVECWNVGSVRIAEAVLDTCENDCCAAPNSSAAGWADVLAYASLRPRGAPTADQHV
jgi:[ribosomal protein S5]-alanine N-acetyltransferase